MGKAFIEIHYRCKKGSVKAEGEIHATEPKIVRFLNVIRLCCLELLEDVDTKTATDDENEGLEKHFIRITPRTLPATTLFLRIPFNREHIFESFYQEIESYFGANLEITEFIISDAGAEIDNETDN